MVTASCLPGASPDHATRQQNNGSTKYHSSRFGRRTAVDRAIATMYSAPIQAGNGSRYCNHQQGRLSLVDNPHGHLDPTPMQTDYRNVQNLFTGNGSNPAGHNRGKRKC
ncbi:MAG: hypothetical protein ACWGOX_02490 [Desulforhopalus sp.]